MTDEEMVQHPFNSRTPYEPGDDRDIWCKDCEYHRDHAIHRLTDLQTLTSMFARAHIACVLEQTRTTDASHNNLPLPAGVTLVAARADYNTPKHFGYRGFYAEFYFDPEGQLVGVGAWE